jgi:hypothetical protein
MTDISNDNLNADACSTAVWRKYQQRGVIAQSRQLYREAVVQFSIAAFVLRTDSSRAGRVCRVFSLISLANVYLIMRRYDRMLLLLREVMLSVSGLLPSCQILAEDAVCLMATLETATTSCGCKTVTVQANE